MQSAYKRRDTLISLRRKLHRAEAKWQEAEAELKTAREAADLAGLAQTKFLAMMSHEIRTPLNGIIGMAALMLDSTEEQKQAGEDRHSLGVIMQSGEHLLQLLNDILDVTRLESGQFRLEETAFDVRTTISSAVSLMQPQVQRKGLKLSLSFTDDVPLRAGGDAGRLRQILLNLIGNAAKFTETGSVSVAVSRLGYTDGTVRLECRVSDTGIGIAPESLSRIFEEFTQADTSIARRFGGSGLGLAISRRLVAEMGGTLTAESVQGQGSVFRFDIQLRARRASDLAVTNLSGSEPASIVSTVAVKLTPKRVLVAEDNATNRLVVTRMLERLGHSVETVTNGREAVEAVQTGTYDVVLMDVMMPEMDGLQATMAIRALLSAKAHLPIIGLTANAEPSDALACRQAGMNGFATKPISSERLSQAMHAALAPMQAPEPAIDPQQPLPYAGENRLFDPAVLDQLVMRSGKAEASSAIADFIEHSTAAISRQHLGATVPDARAIAATAASFGLMRAARMGLDLTDCASADALAVFTQVLSQSVEELRSWRRLTLL